MNLCTAKILTFPVDLPIEGTRAQDMVIDTLAGTDGLVPRKYEM